MRVPIFQPQHLGKRQKGLATLLIALIIMVAVTITVIFTAQTAILEQRMSANEMRMKQTANAAQGGIEHATHYVQGGFDIVDQNGQPAVLGPSEDQAGQSTYRALFLPPEAINWDIDCPDTPSNSIGDYSGVTSTAADTLDVVLLSCGWSDDRSARKGIMTALRAGPSVANPPTNPLITRGGVNTNGRARVFNAFNTLTIWSGSDLSVTGNPGNTFVREEGVAPPTDSDLWPLESLPNSCQQSNNYVCRTGQQAGVGPDVIDGDLALGSLNDADFFRGFMGDTLESYRENQVTPLGDHESTEQMISAGKANNKVLWVDGDYSLNDPVGTREEPAVLVVDGNLDVTGNARFYGILYVTGDLNTGGSPRFHGATVIQGDTVSAGGTPYFIFDPVSARGASNIGARGTVSGSWRDWTATNN
ncbi:MULTISPECIES: PilX N-terminal domain-containing pilus assembly protein [unclassified Thioalkalivibrio]|uniref:pilus assembly PilX family protein n=1 Tax=unclassified Thioalkalivibrio TaxID=2621013 RepID=UPI0003631C44|nr:MULTISPECIES: PilX N-terminal domain-containing pilus assembly protein [unclassified Thioalkalivibrio]